MHKIGCPTRLNPYAQCECAQLDLQEHTSQMEQFNNNVSKIDAILKEKDAELARL